MKFAVKLSAHLTPEWRKQYIDYDGLKEFLLTYIDKRTKELKEWDAEFIAFLDEQDKEFFELCSASLIKVNSFFAEKLAESKRKYATLLEELQSFLDPERKKSGLRRSVSRKYRESISRSYAELSEDQGRDGSEATKFESHGIDDIHLRRRVRYSSSEQPSRKISRASHKKEKTYRRLHEFKLAFSEFYLSLVLLQNYQMLNFTGFRKILKKHDKLFRRANGTEWRKANVDGAEFNTNREIDGLISSVEDIYTDKLEHGDRSKAMKRLRVPPLSERHNPKAVFWFGFFGGVFVAQTVVIILTYIFLRPLPTNNIPAVRIFRATFLIIFFLSLFGLNTYGWRTSGVNHVLIFEINPRSHLDHYQLFAISFFLANVWGCAVLYYMYSEVLHVPSYLSPLILVIFLLLCLLNPFNFAQHRARRWLLRKFGRMASAPFFEVKFADFWLGDQLNSMTFLFPEIAFFICFYTSQVDWSDGLKYVPLPPDLNVANGTAKPTVPKCAYSFNTFQYTSCQCSGLLFGLEPILRSLPAWFRFAQCLRRYRDMRVKKLSPHVINAGKYSTTFLVQGCTVWRALSRGSASLIGYLLARIIQSTYSYSWDIRMDWGLLDCQPPHRLLREETVYQYRAYYYFAIVEDFILRFSWAIRIGIEETLACPPEMLATISATFEVFRRFVWNFFRLENEHLNNCGEFRAVRDIFIRPERREAAVNVNNANGLRPLSIGKKFKRKGSDDDLTKVGNSYLQPVDNSSANNNTTRSARIWDRVTNVFVGQRPSYKTQLDNACMVEMVEAGHNRVGFQYTIPSKVAIGDDLTHRSAEDIYTVAADQTVGDQVDTTCRTNTPPLSRPSSYQQDVESRIRSPMPSIVTLHVPEEATLRKAKSKGTVSFVSLADRSTSPSLNSKDASWDSASSSDAEPTPLRQNATTTTLLIEDPDRMQEKKYTTLSPVFTSPNPADAFRPQFTAASYTSLGSTASEQQDCSTQNTVERIVIVPRTYREADPLQPTADLLTRSASEVGSTRGQEVQNTPVVCHTPEQSDAQPDRQITIID
ncbi:Xenotropic and polytropic retrovirus receptor 1 [Clonorchis sinensis]|uniref:Xenotropic and polytropic retrovirus receptor 1 n=2 Tax=Clonorchis sinensis TaxID=79923 RepID=A0A8T1MED4_CLOSI|nr:Xenotropic and polytropic retrovirus receptor 1 [Clonorchis sinensis]